MYILHICICSRCMYILYYVRMYFIAYIFSHTHSHTQHTHSNTHTRTHWNTACEQLCVCVCVCVCACVHVWPFVRLLSPASTQTKNARHPKKKTSARQDLTSPNSDIWEHLLILGIFFCWRFSTRLETDIFRWLALAACRYSFYLLY
jgi:hypothetical protein